jgi:hypothetical protein
MAKTLGALASILAFGVLSSAAAGAERAQGKEHKIELRPGQAIVIPVAVVEQGVVLGIPHGVKPGAVAPEEGEIEVEVVKKGLSPYADLSASEKTDAAVDFVASGLIGNIKIDEVVVCGKLDTPSKTRIASGAWIVSLHGFTVHKDGQGCP